ncbi:hypothetical protein B6V01_003925 [Methanosarcinales archaeon ex4572_44]|nr:MAG: hypothetical protein B6V01_003925 [Methanosarcinales archaeon ex4572_44]
MDLVEEYLKIAKKDLKATKILYENKLYPQSLFYFAQSVEKANKALALGLNEYTEEDMRKVNHDATRIYKDNIIELKQKYEDLSRNLNRLPELKNTDFVKNLGVEDTIKECNGALKQHAEIQKAKTDLAFISPREIREILIKISKTEKEMEEGIENVKNFKLTENNLKETKEELFRQLENPKNNDFAYLLKKELSETKFTIQELEILIKQMYLQSLHYITISTALFYLAVITLPYSVSTRYPKGDLYPTKIYNRRLPIVKKLPDLISLQSKTLIRLNKYCTKYIFNQKQ